MSQIEKVTINVVNVHQHKPTLNDVYIGRGSALGNPFTHLPLEKSKAVVQVATRDEAVKSYKNWIRNQIIDGDKAIVGELNKIKLMAENRECINLVCYCKPKSCHGDVIKEIILTSIENNIPIQHLVIKKHE